MKIIFPTFSVKTLAIAFFPTEDDPRKASQRFRRQLKLDPQLHARLVRAGLRPKQRTLTQRQVEIIIQHLGWPSGLSREGCFIRPLPG